MNQKNALLIPETELNSLQQSFHVDLKVSIPVKKPLNW